jgi:hypothetical protein
MLSIVLIGTVLTQSSVPIKSGAATRDAAMTLERASTLSGEAGIREGHFLQVVASAQFGTQAVST